LGRWGCRRQTVEVECQGSRGDADGPRGAAAASSSASSPPTTTATASAGSQRYKEQQQAGAPCALLNP